MKRLAIATLVLVMLVGSSAFATQTRGMVMGDNHMVLVDDYNMFWFPGRTLNYPNLAIGEFSDGPDEQYQFGITWQFNEDNPWVLGTFISSEPQFGPESYFGDDLAMFPWYGYSYGYPSKAAKEIDGGHPRRVQLMYGRQLGNQNFGFSLDIVRVGWEADQDSTEFLSETHAKQSFNQYTFGLGLTEQTSGQWDIAAHFMTGGWTNEAPDGEKINEPSGYYDFAVLGRYFWVRNPTVTWVPHAAVTMGKRGVEEFFDPTDAADDEKTEFSRMAVDLGIGLNYTPGPAMLAVLDLSVMYETIKGEYSGAGLDPEDVGEEKVTYMAYPYLRIGFEGEVFKWMDYRAGATASLWSHKDKFESDFAVDQTWDEPWNELYFGLGFNWGRLYIDTYTDPELLLDGFHFISGSDEVDDLNFEVSVLYELF